MLFSVDHGNFACKTPNFNFISGLSEHTVKPPLASDVIEYADRFWTLSGQRISYMRDKTRDERFFILTLFAIAKELKQAGIKDPIVQTDLAVGLPPEHYGVLKSKFGQYFKRAGSINFVYNEVPMSICIKNVFVYPQAYAAVVPQSQALINIPRIFIIDVGGITTDILLLRYGKPDLQFCRSLEMGVITMNNDIIGKISTKHDMLLDDEHIAAIIQDKDTILPDEVKQSILRGTEHYANLILDKLRELQVDLRSNPAIFIGGGSSLFKAFLEKSPLVVKSDFICDPKANAIGYELMAAAQLRNRSA